ncbi:hypothetical protein MP228_003436 [Amoeboaphelidium protococcarum]|nr:hypothetical protein MP228_003436 [Amoeboaphelidium protococcarum]
MTKNNQQQQQQQQQVKQTPSTPSKRHSFILKAIQNQQQQNGGGSTQSTPIRSIAQSTPILHRSYQQQDLQLQQQTAQYSFGFSNSAVLNGMNIDGGDQSASGQQQQQQQYSLVSESPLSSWMQQERTMNSDTPVHSGVLTSRHYVGSGSEQSQSFQSLQLSRNLQNNNLFQFETPSRLLNANDDGSRDSLLQCRTEPIHKSEMFLLNRNGDSYSSPQQLSQVGEHNNSNNCSLRGNKENSVNLLDRLMQCGSDLNDGDDDDDDGMESDSDSEGFQSPHSSSHCNIGGFNNNGASKFGRRQRLSGFTTSMVNMPSETRQMELDHEDSDHSDDGDNIFAHDYVLSMPRQSSSDQMQDINYSSSSWCSPHVNLLDSEYFNLLDHENYVTSRVDLIDTAQDYLDRQYDVISKIGSGQYAEVLLVKSRSDGNLYAVKRAFNPYSGAKDRLNAIKEVEILLRLRQNQNYISSNALSDNPIKDNVIHLHEAWEQAGILFIVTEYCSRGTLSDFIVQSQSICQFKLYSVALQIAQGLLYIHSLNIVHLDLTSFNILLAADGTWKIADFGLSQLCYTAESSSSDIKDRAVLGRMLEGDRRYIAPEVLNGDYLPVPATDVFMFGLILLQMTTMSHKQLPDNGPEWTRLRNEDFSQVVWQQDISLELQQFTITKLLRRNFEDRAQALELVQFFLKQLNRLNSH